jgi:mannosyltransferase OCH1-like enzyme
MLSHAARATPRTWTITMIAALRKFLSRGSAPVEPAPTVFQYWDRSPPPDVASWMRTWRNVEPDFRLEQFDDESAAWFIQSQMGAEAEAAYRMCKAPAMKSDFFRYCALFARGGIYADADTVYKGHLASLYSLGSRGVLLRRTRGPGVRLTNMFIIVRKAGDALLDVAVRSAMENIHARKSQSVWQVTGPAILREAYKSERRAELFSGFEILGTHSRPVLQVIAYQKGEYKKGERDWRRMQEASISIYDEDAGDGSNE